RIQFEVGSDVEEIVVDQTRFRQIMVNLISNAIKYNKPGGTIWVKLMRVDNEIDVSIRDEGMGIKPEEMGRLFHAFQQASNAEYAGEGTGLGLVITKRLVELHGGRIWVESEWGKGSTFTFRFPMVLPGEVVQSADQLIRIINNQPPPVLESNEKPLVLIIEDNRPAIQLLETYLQEAGYRTAVAGNGLEGLEKAKELRPHLITLDIFMPQKDGWQVIQELKRHPVCKNIPIIIISISDEKKLGFSMGAVDYFVKPVNKRELLDALSRIPLRKPGGSQPKVLVIDDDRNALDLIEVILNGEGYDVVKTFDGKDGIVLAARENPDLIILDLIMPGMSGFNVAFQLKQQESTRHTPIIILTSMDVDEDTREKMAGYVNSVLKKTTFTKNDLLREINAAQKVR
ncbi:MAG TPA: response regulator, partial [Bacteroidota bacterium]|nr:response regulator [Bacteroidota bacterium]